MGTYASVEQVQARNPYRAINDSTSPSSTVVSSWIDEAEAMLTTMLRSSGCTVPITGSEGIVLMRAWVIDYASALVRMAYAAAGGGDDNKDGQDEYNRFIQRLDDISKYPARYEDMLQSTSNETGSTRQTRCYVLDNIDGKSVAGGDFAPTFKMGVWWS